jgi:tetratricopeptide (TPR) repeat protein
MLAELLISAGAALLFSLLLSLAVPRLMGRRAKVKVGHEEVDIALDDVTTSIQAIQSKLSTGWARTEHSRRAFALLKRASDLRPRDLGLEFFLPGEQVGPFTRSLSPLTIPRRVERIAEEDSPKQRRIYTERQLAEAIKDNQSFIVLGPPADGKSFVLYQVVRLLETYQVVVPFLDRPVPPQKDFEILRGSNVVLLIDDLHRYARSAVNLTEFVRLLDDSAMQWAVAAACRTGPDLAEIWDGVHPGLLEFFESIPIKVKLIPPAANELAHLPPGSTRFPAVFESEDFSAIGFETFVDPVRAMQSRFKRLSPIEQDALRSMNLLFEAGVVPITRHRLLGVLVSVFGRELAQQDLNHVLRSLVEESFIYEPEAHDVIRPMTTVFSNAVIAEEGSGLARQLELLIKVLLELGDEPGLRALGDKFLQQSRFSQAVECFRSALRLQPSLVESWTSLGYGLQMMGQYQDAVEAFDQSLRLLPNFAEAWNYKGNALSASERHDRALEAYEEALRLRPSYADAWVGKGKALYELGMSVEALEAYDQATRVQQEAGLADGEAASPSALENLVTQQFSDPDILHNRGLALFSLGRYEEALSAFDAAIRLRPDDPDTLHMRGIVLSELARLEESLESFDSALLYRPEDPSILHNRGASLALLGRYEDALQMFETALRFYPEDAQLLSSQGAALHALGRSAEALSSLQAALAYEPENPIVLSNLAAALGDLGRHEEALKYLDVALEARPDLVEMRINRASALIGVGRREEALEELDAAIELIPDHPGALSVRGGILVELGRYEEAVEELDRSLQLRPDFPKTLYNRGLALSGLGRFEAALSDFDRALGGFGDAPQLEFNRFLALYHRAMALVALGRDEEALLSFNAAIELRPHDAPAHYNRGVTLSDLGRFEEALGDFMATLNAEPRHANAISARNYVLEKLGRQS